MAVHKERRDGPITWLGKEKNTFFFYFFRNRKRPNVTVEGGVKKRRSLCVMENPFCDEWRTHPTYPREFHTSQTPSPPFRGELEEVVLSFLERWGGYMSWFSFGPSFPGWNDCVGDGQNPARWPRSEKSPPILTKKNVCSLSGLKKNSNNNNFSYDLRKESETSCNGILYLCVIKFKLVER